MQLADDLHWHRSSPLASPRPDQDLPTDHFDPIAVSSRGLAYQRHVLAAWYYAGLMNLHRPYVMHSPPILPPPGSAAGTRHMLNPSRDRCIEVAITMTRVLCSFHDKMEELPERCRIDAGAFTYFTFDGAVACAGALSQIPPHPKKDECMALMNRAISALQRRADSTENAFDGSGEVAKRGIVVLKALKKAAGWEMNDDEKGELVLLQDMLKKQRAHGSHEVETAEQRSTAPQPTDVYSSPGDSSWNTQPKIPDSIGLSTPPYVTEPRNMLPSGPPTFIPYLSSSSADLSSTPIYPTQSSGATSQSFVPPTSNSFSELPYGLPNSTWFGVGTSLRPPAQSMVLPFEVLQGVQSTTQEPSELDLNWIKLAGMESWFTNPTS